MCDTAAFLKDRELRGLSANTIRFYRTYLNQWETRLASRTNGDSPAALLRQWIDSLSPQTGAAVFRAVRALELFAEASGGERSWIHDCQGWKFRPAPIPQALDQARFEKILAQLDLSLWPDRRDFAVLSVLWHTGARSGAVLGLRVEDVDLTARTLNIQTKGGVKAPIVLPAAAVPIVQEWLPQCGGAYVFPATKDRSAPLNRDWLSRRFRDLARAAGIRRRVWIHLLRHSWACRMLDQGVSVAAVSRQLTHTTWTMTQRYARISLGRVRQEIG